MAQSKNIFEAFVKLALHLPPRHDKEMNVFKVVGGSRQIKARLGTFHETRIACFIEKLSGFGRGEQADDADEFGSDDYVAFAVK